MSDSQLSKTGPDILQSFFETAPVMMGIADVEGNDIRHISDNPEAAKFFGRPVAEIQGKLASEMGISRKQIDLWIKNYREAEAQGRPRQFEYYHETHDEPRWFSVLVNLIGKTSKGHSRFSYIVILRIDFFINKSRTT